MSTGDLLSTGPSSPSPQVRRRIVFYVSGFDPQGPAHYHRLFSEQALKQAEVSGYHIAIGPRQTLHPYISGWDIYFESQAGVTVESQYRFLRWDDLVRRHWLRGRWRLAWLTAQTSVRLFSNGSWWRMCRSSWVAGLTLALPICVGMLGAGLSATAIGALYLGLRGAPSVSTTLVGLSAFLVSGVGIATGLAKFWLFGQGDWLMRSTYSLLRMARNEAPDIEARIDAWADLIASSLSEPDIDEVLLVAHSSGCIAAVSALARAFRTHPNLVNQRARLGFLTLGQCIPVLSYQPEAAAYRRELEELRQTPALTWVDVTAPPDACCFALMDPTNGPDGVQFGESAGSVVKRVSPRYAEQMTPNAYKILKADKYRCHFQYLMAFESTPYYDYFQWVCGSESLNARTRNMPSVTNFTRFRW